MDMDLTQLLAICDGYAEMGPYSQEQMVAVLLDGESIEEQNPNALRDAVAWLRDVARLAEFVGGKGSTMPFWRQSTNSPLRTSRNAVRRLRDVAYPH